MQMQRKSTIKMSDEQINERTLHRDIQWAYYMTFQNSSIVWITALHFRLFIYKSAKRDARACRGQKQQIATQTKVLLFRSVFVCSIAQKMDTNDAFTPSNHRPFTRSTASLYACPRLVTHRRVASKVNSRRVEAS